MLHRFKEQLRRWEEIIRRILRTGRDPDLDFCVERLLVEDPELAGFQDLSPEARRRERYFMRNSVLGFLGYLGSQGG
jgi:hypothetical protein